MCLTSIGNRRAHLTIVGDLVLEHCVTGGIARPGGAARHAEFAASHLDARVTLAGAVGMDAQGRILLNLLNKSGIDPHIWCSSRLATWTQRAAVGGTIHQSWLWCESKWQIPHSAADLLAHAPLGDAILIVDIGRGTCTNELLHALTSIAIDESVPLIVAPAAGRDGCDYAPATAFATTFGIAAEIVGSRLPTLRDAALLQCLCASSIRSVANSPTRLLSRPSSNLCGTGIPTPRFDVGLRSLRAAWSTWRRIPARR